MEEKERKRQQNEAFEDLKFYLMMYHEITSRTPTMKKAIDKEIKMLVERLKKLSNKKG
ncbi:hypothetical protein MT996_11750 [Ornithobacterium rhinotracheale]|uniref:hypothetical protein n=1 Tax=Ornithobacterium rhinotracheale TaxID=28251 RepID=UPI00162A2572|nr:hypothetical protein [Ornithobacterium rhinotracheale]UOH77860.1 hypothetical protein MT996_11750 [Ornithobacterium rhinotracheale]